MTKSKRNLLIALFLLIVVLFFMKAPSPFPNKTAISTALGDSFQLDGPLKINKPVFIDDQHAVVFFSANEKTDGMSFWKWNKFEWTMVSAEINSWCPKVWRINPSDVNSYYIIWNFGLENRYKKVNLYLLTRRNFMVSDGIETYTPSVQLKTKLPIEKQTSGVMKLPEKMLVYLKDEIKIQHSNNTSIFNEHMPLHQFGWMGFDENGKRGILNSSDGNRFGTGGEEPEDAVFLDPSELEEGN